MKAYNFFNLNAADPSWHPHLTLALEAMSTTYLNQLADSKDWLPGPQKIFNAFSLPIDQVSYILLGESPYPRSQSANGYAFWDAAVGEIWSSKGLSKQVNRATSLRNFIKMLLVAAKALPPGQTGQEDILNVNKTSLINTNEELFNNLLNHGFLLLNATLVLQQTPVNKDAIAWQPFIKCILDELFKRNNSIELILLGNVASKINKIINHNEVKSLHAEHPYNITFINNPNVIQFFEPFKLLSKN